MWSDGPREGVFSTLLWQDGRGFADLPYHEARIENHAERLRLQPHMDQLHDALRESVRDQQGACLVRAMWREGTWSCSPRAREQGLDHLDAITTAAPRWAGRITGTKHAAWRWAEACLKAAEKAGADAALLVHEHRIVDEVRSTPLLLDEDGACWTPKAGDGGVEGITLRVLESALAANGIPVMRGDLNERRVARARAMVLVGTGLGVSNVVSIDGVEFEDPRLDLFEACSNAYEAHLADPSTWSLLEVGT